MTILEKVWDYDFDPGTNLVDVYVRRLREKIDADFEPKLLHTVRGVGYVLREAAMSIRTRLTLWYAAVMFVSLTLDGRALVRRVRPRVDRPSRATRASANATGGRPRPQRLRRSGGDHPVVRRAGGGSGVWAADGG